MLFLDGGNVWANPWDFKLNDLRYDVGPGLRYKTPIGPIRADIGYQLNPIPGLLVNGEPEAAALPLPLQHRPGVLTRSTARFEQTVDVQRGHVTSTRRDKTTHEARHAEHTGIA